MSDSLSPVRGVGPGARITWALPLVPVALSGFLLSAMTWFRLHGGTATGDENFVQWLVVCSYELFGFEPLFMTCILVLTWSSIWFLQERVERPFARLGRIAALALCLAILLNLRVDGSIPVGGGELGAFFATRMSAVLNPSLSIFVVAIASIAALLLATDFLFYGYFEGLSRRRGRDGAVEPEVVATLEELRIEVPDAGPRFVPRPLEPVAVTLPEPALVGEIEARDDPAAEVGPQGDDVAAEWDVDVVVEDEAEPSDEPDLEEDADEEGEVGLFAEAEVEAEADDEDEVDVEDEAEDEEEVDDEEEDEAELALAEDEAEDVEAIDDDEIIAVFEDDELSEEDEGDGTAAIAGSEPGDVEVSETEVEPEPDDDGELETSNAEEPACELERSAPTGVPPVQPGLSAASSADPDLVGEARELVLEYRRASANFLKRRLRVSNEEAIALLQELAALGVVECEAGAAHGRVVAEPRS